MADFIVGAIFTGFLQSLGWLPVLLACAFIIRNRESR